MTTNPHAATCQCRAFPMARGEADCPNHVPSGQPEPQLADFASIADYRAARAAASREDRARWSAESDAKLFAAIEAAGGRTEDCEHGYHWHDSCPACD